MNWIIEFNKPNIIHDIQYAESILEKNGISTPQGIHKYLRELSLLPAEMSIGKVMDEDNLPIIESLLEWEANEYRKKKYLILFVQIHTYQNTSTLVANDARGAVYWYTLPEGYALQSIQDGLIALQQLLNKNIALIGHGKLLSWLTQLPLENDAIHPLLLAYISPRKKAVQTHFAPSLRSASLPQHLQKLEDESIFILREAVAEAENPVMLYSIGKDSTVMLHLAHKAFYPAPPPFSLLHVDTRWKFQEMYAFRDTVADYYNIPLIVHTNPEAIEKNINPFDHGASLHTDITKTQGLKQALTQHQFDVVFGGARRDEEKSRAKERIFSFRNMDHQWDPKNQRPELWNNFNGQKLSGESIRVFPLSNWTELDIWEYITLENIPVVPLYFSKLRPVVERNGMLIMVDDHRLSVREGEKVQLKNVRFRTLGCYPLTGAVESSAQNLEDILKELRESRYSERQGRAIDHDASASMEKKKRDGYF